MSTYKNHIITKSGKAIAICQCCGKKSRAVEPDNTGEPDIFRMKAGWSEAPFPKNFKHDDGSTGTLYTCHACNKKLRQGLTLKLRQSAHCHTRSNT